MVSLTDEWKRLDILHIKGYKHPVQYGVYLKTMFTVCRHFGVNEMVDIADDRLAQVGGTNKMSTKEYGAIEGDDGMKGVGAHNPTLP